MPAQVGLGGQGARAGYFGVHRAGRKGNRPVVLNRVAVSVVEQARGIHPEHVFSYRGHAVGTVNNSGWKIARNGPLYRDS